MDDGPAVMRVLSTFGGCRYSHQGAQEIIVLQRQDCGYRNLQITLLNRKQQNDIESV